MKIRIVCKDPDGIGDSVSEAVKADVAKLEGVDEGERELIREDRLERTWAKLSRWIDCQEYLTVEIDTDAGTARVVPQNG